MQLQVLPQDFTVCKVDTADRVDFQAPFCFVGKTDAEFSLVCPTVSAPRETLAREDGWRAFRVAGAMAFSLVGVLSRLTGCLAARKIPVFAVSTFDTDYLLVKADRLEEALAALTADGCAVESQATAE